MATRGHGVAAGAAERLAGPVWTCEAIRRGVGELAPHRLLLLVLAARRPGDPAAAGSASRPDFGRRCRGRSSWRTRATTSPPSASSRSDHGRPGSPSPETGGDLGLVTPLVQVSAGRHLRRRGVAYRAASRLLPLDHATATRPTAGPRTSSPSRRGRLVDGGGDAPVDHWRTPGSGQAARTRRVFWFWTVTCARSAGPQAGNALERRRLFPLGRVVRDLGDAASRHLPRRHTRPGAVTVGAAHALLPSVVGPGSHPGGSARR